MSELSHLHIQALEELVEETKQERERYEKALQMAELKAAKLDVRKMILGADTLSEEELNWRGHGFPQESTKLREKIDYLDRQLSLLSARLDDVRFVSSETSAQS
jgi:hypothetical protein